MKGWQEINGNSYYYAVGGNKVTGWMTMAGDKYYFDSEGILVKNTTIELGGNKYTFNEDGKLRNVTVSNPDTVSDIFTNDIQEETEIYSVDDYGNDDLECDLSKLVIYQDNDHIEEAIEKSIENCCPMIRFDLFKKSGIITREVIWVGDDEV